ncbi:hypothetical protein [uncultured Alistipes sp.]|uniref:hypothetical protein n=1 Tax=uncultured Alistipes sp. TaxID=538949 RepID=UPI00266F072B|nr:hypothetical protein [uncultured Alistipes sp.]
MKWLRRSAIYRAACIAVLFFEHFGPACRAACHTVAGLLFVGLAGIHIKSHRAVFSKDIAQQPSFTYGMANTHSASATSTFRSSFRVQGVTIFNGDLYYTETIYGTA